MAAERRPWFCSGGCGKSRTQSERDEMLSKFLDRQWGMGNYPATDTGDMTWTCVSCKGLPSSS